MSFINLFCLYVSYSVAPMISITEAGRDTAENGRELHSDSKVCVCGSYFHYVWIQAFVEGKRKT